MNSRHPFALVLSAGTLLGAAHAAPGQIEFARVKEELAASLAKQAAKAHELQQDCDYEQYDEMAQGRLVSKIRYRTRRTAHFHLYEADVITPPPADIKGLRPQAISQVMADNSRYRFELERPGGPAEWRLKAIHEANAPGPVPRHLTPEFLSQNTTATRALENGHSIPLTDLFSSPTFKLVSCGPSPTAAALVRVVFEHSEAAPNRPASRSSGWYDLDPASGWSVREADESFNYGKMTNTLHTRLEITFDGSDGLIYPRELRLEGKHRRGETLFAHRRVVSKYKVWVDPAVPEREFKLTAYGLPELVGVAWEKPTPRYVWFLLAGGAFAGLAVGFRYLARRRTLPTPV